MADGTSSKRLSCGVVVTDGRRLLLGHATRSPRWDVPKGGLEPGETTVEAAIRELGEETGLVVTAGELHPLGTHAYLRNKDLCLFAWVRETLPEPGSLRCSSRVTLASGVSFPELDRFGLFAWEAAFALVGRNLARVLAEVRRGLPREG